MSPEKLLEQYDVDTSTPLRVFQSTETFKDERVWSDYEFMLFFDDVGLNLESVTWESRKEAEMLARYFICEVAHKVSLHEIVDFEICFSKARSKVSNLLQLSKCVAEYNAPEQETVPVVQPIKKRNSRKQKAIDLYEQNKTLTNKELIDLFVTNGIEHKTAVVYASNVKHLWTKK